MKQNYLETAEVNKLNFLKGFIWILGAISYHLHNFKMWQTPTEERYF